MEEILKVNFAGVTLANPIILGSATPSWDGETSKQAALAGAGAVVPKTIGPPLRFAQHPRCGRLRLIRQDRGRSYGMVNLELYTTMTKERWVERELKVAAQGGARVIASVVAQPSPTDTAQVAQEVAETGYCSLLEINVSCPMPDAHVGYRIGQSAELVYEQAREVKSRVSIPVGVKLTPNVSDMVPVAQAAAKAGADFLTISNSVRSFAGVDIETGRPYLPAFGGYTGPAIKPIIQRFVAEVAKAVDLPISALGGVRSWRDVVEYIMLGATTVQTVTAVMWEGYEALGKLLGGLRQFMERKGYRSIEEFQGVALPYITTIEEYASLPPKFARVERDRCNDCNLCLRVCFYNALYSDGHLQIREANCDGCGLCVEICPTRALRLE